MYLMLFVLLIVTLSALLYLLLAWRVAERRRLQAMMHGACSELLTSVGISVLVPEECEAQHVGQLLMVECERYEVVVVVDGMRQRALFEQLVTRYRLIRVEYLPTGEFPVEAVRGLYRSRKRCFRHLVLLDALVTERVQGLNAAADVATYDYLLPAGPDEVPTAGAIAWLLCELSARVDGGPERLRTTLGAAASLYARSAVARVGGFGGRRQLRSEWLPTALLRSCRAPWYAAQWWGGVALGVAVVVGWLLALAWWQLLALALTMAAVWLVAVRLQQLTERLDEEGASGG